MLLCGTTLNYAAKIALLLAFLLSAITGAALLTHLQLNQFEWNGEVASTAGRWTHVSATIALVSS